MNLKNFKVEFLLLLVILGGAFLRSHHLDKIPLWQDEAETAFYAKTILKQGIPSAYDGKNFLYVGKFIPFEKGPGVLDSEMYQYSQADFDNYGRLRYHPWGDAMITALSFSLFGISTFSARLPFAIAGIGSVFILYLLGSFLFNKRIGLFAALLQAFNYVIMPYERQVRHYSLNVFFTLVCLYFFFNAFKSNDMKHYLAGTFSLVFLFYTMPIYVVPVIFTLFVAKTLLDNRKLLNSKLTLCVMVFALLILPYFFFFKFWKYPLYSSINFEFIIQRISQIFLDIIVPFSTSTGFFIFLLGFTFMMFRWQKKDIVILTALFSFTFFISILRPEAAALSRLSLILISLICLICGIILDAFYNYVRSYSKMDSYVIVAFVLLLMILVPMIFYDPLDSIKKIKENGIRSSPLLVYFASLNNQIPGIPAGWDPKWIMEAIAFLNNKQISNAENIFTTYQQPSFIFYANHTFFNLLSVNKSFIESLENRHWIIVGPDDVRVPHCYFFLDKVGTNPCPEKTYLEVAKSCKKYTLRSRATVYECNPLGAKSDFNKFFKG